jgi:hypothetical protein
MHEYSTPFEGSSEGALSIARTALVSLGFEILRDTPTELQAEGPGMHSNQQPELLGASSLRFEIAAARLSVAAVLGGVATMTRFIYLFPPLLVAGLLLMSWFLKPEFSFWHVLWVLPWTLIAPFLSHALERRTTRALDRLVRAMAHATSR